jgi:glycosyltransferase involved in cell wall biosynthesis
MRILHIVGTVSPAAGGPSAVIRTLVRYAPADIESEVATIDDPTAPFLEGFPCPVHALGAAPISSGKNPRQRWYNPELSRWLTANRSRFDGVIVHGLWQYTGFAAWRSLRATREHPATPYVVFPHGMLDPYFKHAHPAKHLKKSAYWRLIESRVLRNSLRVLFTTEVERDLALETFRPARWQPLVVAIGADAPPPNTEDLLLAFYGNCPQLRGERFLLFLGRIDRKKGCDLLLRAFAALAPVDPDLHLVMAGPDPTNWRATLQPFIDASGLTHRIHWPGMLQGDAKWGAFAACEAFVLPSHQENFGIAVVEALASSKPVLITLPINISLEIAADNAGLVEPDTDDGVTKLLVDWLKTSDAQRRTMATAALATFQRRYDIRKNAETILRVFAQKSPQTV